MSKLPNKDKSDNDKKDMVNTLNNLVDKFAGIQSVLNQKSMGNIDKLFRLVPLLLYPKYINRDEFLRDVLPYVDTMLFISWNTSGGATVYVINSTQESNSAYYVNNIKLSDLDEFISVGSGVAFLSEPLVNMITSSLGMSTPMPPVDMTIYYLSRKYDRATASEIVKILSNSYISSVTTYRNNIVVYYKDKSFDKYAVEDMNAVEDFLNKNFKRVNSSSFEVVWVRSE